MCECSGLGGMYSEEDVQQIKEKGPGVVYSSKNGIVSIDPI